jgi:hypothetical protein
VSRVITYRKGESKMIRQFAIGRTETGFPSGHAKEAIDLRGIKLAALAAFLLLAGALCPGALAATQSTTTTLAVTAAGKAVTSTTQGTLVTLTAAVKSGTTAVTTGQVNFCNAAAALCSDINLLGTAQLTSAGTATLAIHPAPGAHSYNAVFVATPHAATAYGGSASSAASLTVTGTTTTTFAPTGYPGNYGLTATVTGTSTPSMAPTGAVSFLDTSNSNALLATAALASGVSSLSFVGAASPATAASESQIAVGDFNGDGKLDMAVTNYYGNMVSILLGNGDGTFMAGTSPAVGEAPQGIVAGDFNGDGKLDLAVANTLDRTVTILLGKGDGTFMAGTSLKSGYPGAIAIGDFNGDGKLDLAILDNADGWVTILLGNGDGTFTAIASSPAASGSSIVAADFNGDGKLDLATSGGTVLLGNGD